MLRRRERPGRSRWFRPLQIIRTPDARNQGRLYRRYVRRAFCPRARCGRQNDRSGWEIRQRTRLGCRSMDDLRDQLSGKVGLRPACDEEQLGNLSTECLTEVGLGVPKTAFDCMHGHCCQGRPPSVDSQRYSRTSGPSCCVPASPISSQFAFEPTKM